MPAQHEIYGPSAPIAPALDPETFGAEVTAPTALQRTPELDPMSRPPPVVPFRVWQRR